MVQRDTRRYLGVEEGISIWHIYYISEADHMLQMFNFVAQIITVWICMCGFSGPIIGVNSITQCLKHSGRLK